MKDMLRKLLDDTDWEDHIQYCDIEGFSMFHRLTMGYSGCQCTGYAITLALLLREQGYTGTLEVIGRSYEDFRPEISCGGHDVLLVADRFILDPWPTEVPEIQLPDLYDLEDIEEWYKFDSVFDLAGFTILKDVIS
jgi:hypothetical protein